MGKVSVSTKGADFALLVGQDEFNKLGLDPNGKYELVRAKEGVWVLLAEEVPEKAGNPLDKKIFALLKKKGLKDRVEDKFEEFLNKEELKRFKELIREGNIVPFKLSPKYKKAVYKTVEEVETNVKMGEGKASKTDTAKPVQKEAAKPEQKEAVQKETAKPEPKPEQKDTQKPKAASPSNTSLKKDGFLVCKNVNEVKALSESLKKDIEDGKIKGIKGFDGMYHIVKTDLYEKHRAKIISTIKDEKGLSSAGVAEKMEIDKTLVKIICELLKDEGEIIEKRKDQFQAI